MLHASIGSVHLQNTEPNAYYFRTINFAEINYSNIEKELLSLIDSTKHFRPYLYICRSEIQPDHKPLVWLSKLKELNSQLTRLIRWQIKLNEYDFKVIHKKCKTNYVADALSCKK